LKIYDFFPKVVIILRGYTYEQIKVVAQVVSESKYYYGIEIPLSTDHAIDDLKKLNKEFKDLYLGAGTILNVEQLKEVVDIRLKFALSPITFSKEMIDICKSNDIVSVPAAYTPTEIAEMIQQGADIVKIFPANSLGSSFLKDIQAPLGKLPLMAVGGVDRDNASSYIDNGASFLGIGSGIFDKEDIITANYNNIKKSLEAFEKDFYEKM